MRKSVQTSRRAYVRKMQKEFKGIDIGYKGDWFRAVKSAKAYNDFKKAIKKTREKQKIKKDYAKIQSRYKSYQEKETLRRKEALWKMYEEEPQTVGTIWSQREQLGLTKMDYTDRARIQKKIYAEFEYSTIREVSYERTQKQLDKIRDEQRKKPITKVGAVFKKHYDDPVVADMFESLQEMILNDQDAVNNVNILVDHLYGNIIKNLYEGDEARYDKKTHRSDTAFWKIVTKKMIRKYKELQVPFMD